MHLRGPVEAGFSLLLPPRRFRDAPRPKILDFFTFSSFLFNISIDSKIRAAIAWCNIRR